VRTAHRSRARTLTCQSFHERKLPPPDPTAGRDATGGHGREGQVVAIAINGAPRHRWRPRMWSCPNREASQVCPIRGSRHREFSPQNSQLRHRLSPDLCARPATGLSAQKLTASRPPTADRRPPTAERIGLLGFGTTILGGCTFERRRNRSPKRPKGATNRLELTRDNNDRRT